MFNKIKQFFISLFHKGAPEAVEVIAPVIAAPPPVIVAPAPRPTINSHMQAHRERRLKRLQAISNPPAWVLSEIEELKRTD